MKVCCFFGGGGGGGGGAFKEKGLEVTLIVPQDN